MFDRISGAEREALERRIENARRRQLRLPPIEEVTPPTEAEIAERDYCSELSDKILAHELDASKFWDLKQR